jgi:hypothetical protein
MMNILKKQDNKKNNLNALKEEDIHLYHVLSTNIVLTVFVKA